MDAQIDRQTDMTKLIVAFHNFVNMPKNTYRILVGKFEGKDTTCLDPGTEGRTLQ